MRDPQAAWMSFGRHRYQIQEDVLVFEPHGKFALSEAVQLIDLVHGIFLEHGFVYTIVDSRDADAGDARVRKMFADDQRLRTTLGVTYITGANLAIRSFALLWQNVVRLLGRPSNALRFVESEEAAWRQIDKEREERRTGSNPAL